MAAPSSEQSGKMSNIISEQEQPSISSIEVPTEPESKELLGDVQEPAPIAEPEKKEVAEPSAFHVVSYPDGHKELTTNLLEACNPITQIESPASASCSIRPSGSGKEDDVPKEILQVKHFSAKVVQQEHIEDGTSNKETASTTEAEENQILAQTESEAVAMEGVNFEDIDDAVERALLGEVGEDSCGKSAGDNSIELEGLQTKTADLNGRCDSGLNDRSGDPLGTPQTHRIEKVYNIDEETRMGLDATPVSDQSVLKESFTYPSLPPKKLFQIDDTKDSEASDIETKMSMSMTDTEDIRLSHTVSIDDSTNVSVASDSNTEAPTTTSTRKPFRATREGIGVSHDGLSEGGERVFTAENLFEYRWPLDGGDWHLLQEQVSEYLGIKSFKRKYPDLDRRVCDKEEKDFLRDRGVVTETQSDLGLTALRSEEVYDLMMKDYNEKYQEYITFLQEKQRKVIREKHKEYSEQAKIDKSKMESYSKKAARSAAEFNAHMMREKKDERRAYFDLQTYTVHFPKNKFSTLPPRRTKIGAYPVAILTGQYQDRYRKYSPEELKYFPVKTVLHDPRKTVKYVRAMPESVRLAILEKQKPPPPPVEEIMEVQEVVAEDNTENKENTAIPESTTGAEVETPTVVIELAEPVTPQLKVEKKSSVKSSSKKRPKIELSPERPKKTFKKARESLREAEAATVSEESQAADGAETNKADGKNLLPKIHGLEKCRICKQRSTKEERKNEKIVKCAQCGKIGHTNCLDLTEELVAVIKTYPWQCMECKTCVKCLDPFDEDKMMFCDRCDRGYHTFCIGLEALPTGHWECGNCEGVPIELPKNKPETNVDKTISEVLSSEEIKSEVVDASSSPATKNISPIEPTLQEKQELLEEGEIPPGASTTATPGTDSGISETAVPNGNDSRAAVTPASLLKIERRGRKRKYPSDPNKPKVSHKKAKAPDTPKQDRVTGERQSRRLKLREEEEEEKKKKIEEKLEKREKKKKKMLRRLASEAAAAAALAAAESYAASHPDEDCGDMLAQAKAQQKEDAISENTEKTGEAEVATTETSENIKSSDSVAQSVAADKPVVAKTKEERLEEIPHDLEIDPEQIGDLKSSPSQLVDPSKEGSEESSPSQSTDLSKEGMDTACPPQPMNSSKKSPDKTSDLPESIDLSKKGTDKPSSPPPSSNQAEERTGTASELLIKAEEADITHTEESHKASEEPVPLPNKEISDSDKPQLSETSESTEQPTVISPRDSDTLTSRNKECVKEEVKSSSDESQEAVALQEKPLDQREYDKTTMAVVGTHQEKSPITPSSDNPSTVQKEPEPLPKSKDVTPELQTTDQVSYLNSKLTEILVQKEEPPSQSASTDDSAPNIPTQQVQDKEKLTATQQESQEIKDTTVLESSLESSSSLKPTELKEDTLSLPVKVEPSSDNIVSHESQEIVGNLSSSAATTDQEDPALSAQSSKLSEAIDPSEIENPPLPSSDSQPIPSSSLPTTAESNSPTLPVPDPIAPPSQAESSTHTTFSDVSLPETTKEVNQDGKPTEVVSAPCTGDLEEGVTESESIS